MKNYSCKICNFISQKPLGILVHINKTHKISIEEYAKSYFKCTNYDILKHGDKFKVKYSSKYRIIEDEKYEIEILDGFYDYIENIKTKFKTNQSVNTYLVHKHKITLLDYVKKYYTNISCIDLKKCKFCNKNDAIIEIKDIDYSSETYKLSNSHGLFCGDDECKLKALEMFWPEYKNDISKFEYIGGKTEYLTFIYNLSKEEGKHIKNSFKNGNNRDSTKCSTSLEAYIYRYGEEEGTKKYNERNRKISENNAARLSYWIKKFGEELGELKWKEHLLKLFNATKDIQTSKSSIKFKQQFLSKFIVEDEKWFNINDRSYRVDFYLPELKTIVEFYGGYWHCDPNIFDKNFYNKSKQMFAYELWEADKNRIKLLNSITQSGILIIWESSFLNLKYEDFIANLNLVKETKGIIYV